MRVLISGISGFIGRHLTTALTAAGDTVWGFAHDTDTVSGATVRQIDLLDLPALETLVRDVAPDAVVHLAGLSHVGSSFGREDLYRRINVEGTRTLLDAIATGAPRAKVVVASSAEVYGAVDEGEQPITEDRPCRPQSPYAESKVETEKLARASGAVILRAFNIIGPGQAPNFALPGFASQLAAIAAGAQEPVIRVGNLSPRRDFSHVTDATAAYRTLMARGVAGEVYNLASGEAHSIRDVLDRLIEVSGVAAEVHADPERCRATDAPLMLGDNAKLRALGWAPRHGLGDALGDLWREAQERRDTP